MSSPTKFALINTTKTTLGPSSLIQYLHGKGLSADYIYAPKDADALYSLHELRLLMEKLSLYSIVGISAFTMSEQRSFQLVRAIKDAFPHIHVILGGPNVIMDPERILLESRADSVCIYEGELPLQDFLIAKNADDAINIPGLWFNRNGHILRNPHAAIVTDLDSIPFSNYKTSPLGKYWRLTPSGFVSEGSLVERIDNPCMQGNFLYMMTTRGCPHSCSYCINASLNAIAEQTHCPRLRRMSTSGIVRALRKAIDDDPSVEQVFFFDDDFSLRTKKELGEFVRAYQAQVGLPFYIFAYPNTTTDEKLDLYQEVGLKNVEFGLQTVSRRVLRKYHRAQNAEHLRRILKRSTEKAYAFTIAFDIITNSPFDTEEDVVQNIRYILSLPGSFELHVHSLHLFPGSPLRIEYGGGTGNEFHEYQDNFSAHAVRYFNEFYTKILFAMQGWHEANEPTYGTLTRREILVMLRSPTNKRVELLAMLDARMAETRVGLFYNELHHV